MIVIKYEECTNRSYPITMSFTHYSSYKPIHQEALEDCNGQGHQCSLLKDPRSFSWGMMDGSMARIYDNACNSNVCNQNSIVRNWCNIRLCIRNRHHFKMNTRASFSNTRSKVAVVSKDLFCPCTKSLHRVPRSRKCSKDAASCVRHFSVRAVAAPVGDSGSNSAFTAWDTAVQRVPKRTDIKTIMLLGAGPIVIGQVRCGRVALVCVVH